MFEKSVEVPFEFVNKMDSWEHFESEMRRLFLYVEESRKGEGATFVSPPLFRGQSNSHWALSTTLDRATNNSVFLISEYTNLVEKTIKEIEHKFPNAFSLLPGNRILKGEDVISSKDGLEFVAAMAYLRHHGFPSPLLDWTTSVDVATYFAFRESIQSEYVAIFVLLEYFGSGKVFNPRKPYIHSIGHHLNAHPRHKNQMSEYTMCMIYDGEKYYYAQHGEALNIERKAQDIVLKFEIPATERQNVLKILENKKISTTALMGETEDAFIKDLSIKHF